MPRVAALCEDDRAMDEQPDTPGQEPAPEQALAALDELARIRQAVRLRSGILRDWGLDEIRDERAAELVDGRPIPDVSEP